MGEITFEKRKELCLEFFKLAKESLQKQGVHPMLLFLVNEDQIMLFPNTTELDKYDYTQLASNVAEQMGTLAIVCISEIYASVMDKDDSRVNDPTYTPSQDPDHREALAVIVTDPCGDACVNVVYFQKIENQIVFGEEEWMDHSMMNMIPPWKKMTIH